jgi:hypothetical protein
MNIFKKVFLSIATLSLMSITSVFAWWIDHFEVKLTPENSKIWEALDLEITAVDKNNNTVVDYNWTILIFSESDPEAELPSSLEENTYTFKESDQWVIKFENAVKFKTKGKQDIHIYDLNDDTVLWVVETQIEEDEKEVKLDIEILSPENNLVIWENKITVTWSSKKNHSIKIIVNDEQELKTTSNNEGIFEKEIENLEAWENTFKAQILDSESKVVWESKTVTVKIESNLPTLKNIKITPKEVETESSFEVEVIANEGLSEVNVIINEVLSSLKEDERNLGTYTKNIYSPEKAWNYNIDVVLKDELWHEIKELAAANLVVKQRELAAAKEEKTSTWETNTWVIVEEDKNDKLEITWLKVIELKSKSILSWDKIEKAEWYNVYKKLEDWKLELIEKVTEPKIEIEWSKGEVKYEFFAIKATAKTSSWELYEWSLSDATKVKTGPEIFILFILSLLIWAIFIFSRRKA